MYIPGVLLGVQEIYTLLHISTTSQGRAKYSDTHNAVSPRDSIVVDPPPPIVYTRVTLFGILESPIELKVYTFLGLMNSAANKP